MWTIVSLSLLFCSTIAYKVPEISLIEISSGLETSHCARNCSYHGKCDNGKCHCFQGYGVSSLSHEQDCSEYTLKMCVDSCYGRGDCNPTSEGMKCACSFGLHEDNCSRWSRCESLSHCSGHGACARPNDSVERCFCEKGYRGADCSEQILSCHLNCSGHGTCLVDHFNFTCLCDEGFSGEGCEFVHESNCPNSCSGQGHCVNGTCKCGPKTIGVDCSEVVNECDYCVNGHCSYGRCKCIPGFIGLHCETYVPSLDKNCSALNFCNGFGICVSSLNSDEDDEAHCECFEGFSGPTCSELDTETICPNSCSGNGRCVLRAESGCHCNPGWVGKACNVSLCSFENGIVCNGRGVCEKSEKLNNKFGCSCDEGYLNGPLGSCEWKDCPSKCSGNGDCVNGTCLCLSGFSGESCSVVVSLRPNPTTNTNTTKSIPIVIAPTEDDICNPVCVHGVCKGHMCVCNSEFIGVDCTIPVNRPDGFEEID